MSKMKEGRIGVWWDMEDCPIPEGFRARWVRPSIVRAFRELGFSGRVSIRAYGDQNQTPDHVLRGLTSTRVHVLHTVPDVKCERMFSDLMEWRRLNPPPATMMLISDQVSHVFSWALFRLLQQTPNYNLCVAYQFISASTTWLDILKEWRWESLLRVSRKSIPLVRWKLNHSSNSTGMYCKLCLWESKRLKDFRNHLSSQEHALKEGGITPSIPLSEYEQPLEACFGVQRIWGENSPAEPEYATAKIAVWWYMDDCPIPNHFDPLRVRPTIESAFEKLGYTGPVSISAYGNLNQIPKDVLQALSSTRVDVLHALLDVVYSRMFSDLQEWRWNNPPPATMMLISNRIDMVLSMPLASAQLLVKYNMFLACGNKPSKTSVLLTSAEWLWESLLQVSLTRRQVSLARRRVSLTRRHLSRKRRSGTFNCTLCYDGFESKSVEDTMEHLCSREHKREEDIINAGAQGLRAKRAYLKRLEEMEEEQEKEKLEEEQEKEKLSEEQIISNLEELKKRESRRKRRRKSKSKSISEQVNSIVI